MESLLIALNILKIDHLEGMIKVMCGIKSQAYFYPWNTLYGI